MTRLDDALVEIDETILVALIALDHGVWGPNRTATLVIRDDDQNYRVYLPLTLRRR